MFPVGNMLEPWLDQHWFTGSHAELKTCWLPKRCYISGNLMWFKMAYRVRRMFTGPGEPIIETRWIEPMEYIILKIKGVA